jgi:F-type H+-transporting ATPase subunit gamma
MPSLIDIRRRIRAVKSTQQITKAMKMVAASRMRRAHERILNARPFTKGMLRLMHSLASRVDPSVHPLLAVRDVNAPDAKILLIVVSGDKGLAGSFNSSIIKTASGFVIDRPGRHIALTVVGRKARDFFRRRGMKIREEYVGIFSHLSGKDARAVTEPAIEAFVSGQVDAVYIVYNEFKSIIAQRTVVEQLLPVPRAALEQAMAGAAEGQRTSAGYNEDYDRDGKIDPTSKIDYLYEPDAATIFNELLPRYVESQILHALLESNAAFFAAQMTAMEAATKNSTEMIDSLTLYMNKVRQAAITREIIEVVSGAQAL